HGRLTIVEVLLEAGVKDAAVRLGDDAKLGVNELDAQGWQDVAAVLNTGQQYAMVETLGSYAPELAKQVSNWLGFAGADISGEGAPWVEPDSSAED
ncbi:MAG: hypothetical protein H0T78_00270, partial [Longispora sp.]|nr:hypothetical protein [Longispora sp. (in: high G+C Gram-positive bacteria)]